MLAVGKVVLLPKEEYEKTTVDQDTLYVTYSDESVDLYYKGLKASNVVKVEQTLDDFVPAPETFYIIPNDLGMTLYYSYPFESSETSTYPFDLPYKGLIPVVDSSVQYESVSAEKGLVFNSKSGRINLVGVDSEGGLVPNSVSTTILDSFGGEVGLIPTWSSW